MKDSVNPSELSKAIKDIVKAAINRSITELNAASETLSKSEYTEPTVMVHVAGEVFKHGDKTLPSYKRVIDAIEAAGGAKEGANLDSLNLAEKLKDEMKIEVLNS
jgi:competence protein ComEA